MTTTLLATDRCDQGDCPAQAYVRAILPSGHLLLLCTHHGLAHALALQGQGAVLDWTPVPA